jgi:hypothetical protein
MSAVLHPSKKETLLSLENRELSLLALVVALQVTKYRVYFLRASRELRVMERTH